MSIAASWADEQVRSRIWEWLEQHGPTRPKDVAESLDLPVPVTAGYLIAMKKRGEVRTATVAQSEAEVRRNGRIVLYST